jgi:hypothetical protein
MLFRFLPVLLIAVAACSAVEERERPVWAFGAASLRRDPLPPALDSLEAWGDYYEGARPVAYAVDLNNDGENEFLVRTDSAQCGPYGGCPTKLITRRNGHYVDVLDTLADLVYVTNKHVREWPVLWVYIRGIDGGLFRAVFDGTTYKFAETLRSTRDTWESESEGEVKPDSLFELLQGIPIR